jgi:hypothetical protein
MQVRLSVFTIKHFTDNIIQCINTFNSSAAVEAALAEADDGTSGLSFPQAEANKNSLGMQSRRP